MLETDDIVLVRLVAGLHLKPVLLVTRKRGTGHVVEAVHSRRSCCSSVCSSAVDNNRVSSGWIPNPGRL